MIALVCAHKLVPAGNRAFREVLPGSPSPSDCGSSAGWGSAGTWNTIPGAYASTYGGLATAMVALIFLYTLAAIFLFGGELNGTLIAAKRLSLHKPTPEEEFEDAITTP